MAVAVAVGFGRSVAVALAVGGTCDDFMIWRSSIYQQKDHLIFRI